MTHRARPRVHLSSGGPMWEDRRKRVNHSLSKGKLSKSERAALRKLDSDLVWLVQALRRRHLSEARRLRRSTWEQVEPLPPHVTRDQRRALWRHKLVLRALERQAHGRRG